MQMHTYTNINNELHLRAGPFFFKRLALSINNNVLLKNKGYIIYNKRRLALYNRMGCVLFVYSENPKVFALKGHIYSIIFDALYEKREMQFILPSGLH